MDNTYKVLAILGALAWVPQLIILIKNYFAKPTIRIITEDKFDIGFTSLGPIINTSIALASENKKSLINKIEVELKHENGEIQKFSWKWFEETLHVADLPNSGGSIPTRKNQTAIAINIPKDGLIERKIGFQQNAFQSKIKEYDLLCIEASNNLMKAEKDPLELKSDANYNNLKNHFNNGFNWKIGNYNMKISVFETTLKNPITLTKSFNLAALDITYLKPNIEGCINEIDRIFIGQNIKTLKWNWSTIDLE
jgi:hypothetical protein